MCISFNKPLFPDICCCSYGYWKCFDWYFLRRGYWDRQKSRAPLIEPSYRREEMRHKPNDKGLKICTFIHMQRQRAVGELWTQWTKVRNKTYTEEINKYGYRTQNLTIKETKTLQSCSHFFVFLFFTDENVLLDLLQAVKQVILGPLYSGDNV